MQRPRPQLPRHPLRRGLDVREIDVAAGQAVDGFVAVEAVAGVAWDYTDAGAGTVGADGLEFENFFAVVDRGDVETVAVRAGGGGEERSGSGVGVGGGKSGCEGYEEEGRDGGGFHFGGIALGCGEMIWRC